MKRIRFFYAALNLLGAFLLFSCATHPQYAKNTVTIVAVGDNLIHKQLITGAEDGKGGYDFSKYYQEVKSVIHQADIAFINQETLIAGAEFGYSGYPRFNGPHETGDALIAAGFNVINHASNHTMDKGEAAVYAVINYWKTKRKITLLGIYESPQARAEKKIISVKGMKFGFLSYTYGLNGNALPKDKPYLVSLIDTAVMEKEIDALRPLCDFLIVSMHWGNEYEHTPSARQEELARFLARHHVDIVIGHHPHVLQPMRRIERPDGGTMFCYFSLGNFISAQNELPRMLGGMMVIHIHAGKVIDAELVPLVTHYETDYRHFSVRFLKNYHNTDAAAHALNQTPPLLSRDYFTTLFSSIYAE